MHLNTSFPIKRKSIILIAFLLVSATNSIVAGRFKSNSVYYLNLNGTLIENKEKSSFADLIPLFFGLKPNNSKGLNEVLKNIHTAAQNPKIIGIYLNGGSLKAGYGSLKEIRDALIEFKKTGKFILAYADNFSQSNYYLASVADKIMLNPYGSIDLHGLSSNTRFYKNALDKLGLEMQVVKVGTFKSAVEPYTNTEMSPANREQVKVFLQSIWDNLVKEIAHSRNLTTDTINAIANQFAGLQTTSKIRNLNLVDTLVYKDETDSILNKLVDDNKKAVKVGHYTFTKKNNKSKRDKNKIAIIYADGEIAEDGDINAVAMTKICKTLTNDKSIKAVVLRINSPGGSAFESENIWRALTKLKAKKPLVVSMGNYAASGGYYMSCMATKIYAEPTTITGSIGIFGLFPNLKGLNDKIGLSYDGVKTNTLSDAYTLNRAFTKEEHDLMQANINRGYELFVKRCADGRNKSTEEIKAIAEGRVWTGEDAQKIGLVDELGGTYDAVSAAAKLAKIDSYQLLKTGLKNQSNSSTLQKVEMRLEEQILKNKLGDFYTVFKELNTIQNEDKIQAKLLIDIDF